MSPLALNHLSDGTLVAGMHKGFLGNPGKVRSSDACMHQLISLCWNGWQPLADCDLLFHWGRQSAPLYISAVLLKSSFSATQPGLFSSDATSVARGAAGALVLL